LLRLSRLNPLRLYDCCYGMLNNRPERRIEAIWLSPVRAASFTTLPAIEGQLVHDKGSDCSLSYSLTMLQQCACRQCARIHRL